jgi:hypothetical protein
VLGFLQLKTSLKVETHRLGKKKKKEKELMVAFRGWKGGTFEEPHCGPPKAGNEGEVHSEIL